MLGKLSAEQAQKADEILTRLDHMAAAIMERYASWGLDQKRAQELVNSLDKTADDIETFVFGEASLQQRQAELAVFDPSLGSAVREEIGGVDFAKAAAVLQRDSDEAYMDTFRNPMKPIQTDADEPYMSAYGDDQSSAVTDGEDMTGRELAPEA